MDLTDPCLDSWQIGLASNDGAGGGGLYGRAGCTFFTSSGEYDSWTYGQILGAGQEEKWHHYALVWDKNGIWGVDDGTRKVAIFLDGQLKSNRWVADYAEQFVPLAVDLGLILSYESQGSAAIDNLKIWDVAKTDFSDKSEECGVSPVEPFLMRTTTWGHHTSGEDGGTIRGLAYDGHYYYIADHSDYLIDSRPWDFTGRIYVYDENGFVKRLPDDPPIRGTGFPHGVATDGTKLWTTDYFGGNIYEYKIASGRLLRTFRSPIPQPIRLDFDAKTHTLWLTGYDDPNIYQVDLKGTVVSSFPTSGLGLNKNVALDGKGGILVASSEGNEENIHLLRRYSIKGKLKGKLLEEYSNFYTGYWAMATNINDRHSGFIQDAEPTLNSSTERYDRHSAPPYSEFAYRATKCAPSRANKV